MRIVKPTTPSQHSYRRSHTTRPIKRGQSGSIFAIPLNWTQPFFDRYTSAPQSVSGQNLQNVSNKASYQQRRLDDDDVPAVKLSFALWGGQTQQAFATCARGWQFSHALLFTRTYCDRARLKQFVYQLNWCRKVSANIRDWFWTIGPTSPGNNNFLRPHVTRDKRHFSA